MTSWIRMFTFIAFLSLLFACKLGKSSIDIQNSASAKNFTYDFNKAKVINLSAELVEVSGLCFDREINQLLAVEDENGIIYTLDKNNGDILARDTFYKPGDYEGIAATQDYIYVLKSNGTIYKVQKEVRKLAPQKMKSFITKDYDVEGLEYDPSTDALLISSKFYISDNKKNFRFIYRYDLNTGIMSEAPYLTISREDIKNYIKDHYTPEQAQLKFKKILNDDLDYMHVGPSAVAVHPITGNLYIISSQSKVLLIYDVITKQLIHFQKLDKKTFEQPEGMCFDPAGNLYISSEGKKEAAKLVVIPPSKIGL